MKTTETTTVAPVSAEKVRTEKVQDKAGNNTLEISFGGCSIAGHKAQNQDALAVKQPPPAIRHVKGVAACIADGVSSSENAQQASQTSAITSIEDYYCTPDSWPVRTAVARVLSALNAWLYHHGKQTRLNHNGLVTTFSGVVIKSNTAHIFHVGDSRVYRFRDGKLELLTRDHSQQQSGSRSTLTRALGMDSHLEVDYLREQLEVGDLLVLSTDGVHDWLPQAEWAEMLRQKEAKTSRRDIEKLAKIIVDRAKSLGSDDNLTCLILKIDQLPSQDVDEVHRQLTQLVIPPAMDVGMKLDGFEVQKVIHSGSRSHVYLVKRLEDDEVFVLKMPSENFADDALYLDGFIREAWVGSRLDHAGVMKIYARPSASPFLYHVCEYIEGISLRQWMFDHPDIGLAEVRDITGKLVVALRAFQRMSMVHRDLKPENVLIDKHGCLKIIDFGTVHVSGLAEIDSPMSETLPVGSVDYIAPEYVLTNMGSHQSDIFSLGVIVYEMFAGRVPFAMSHVHRRMPSHTSEWQYTSLLQHRPDLPLWVDVALQKATEPHPNRRYQAMSEFLADLHTPNKSLIGQRESAPLLERNPVGFWQLVSAVLMLVVLVQWYIGAE